MAKTSQPNTGGSQFYFVDKDSTPSHLDGIQYLVKQSLVRLMNFVSGIDATDRISTVTTASDSPVDEIQRLKK